MKILLTGARGFTGRHFKNVAETLGHEIVPLTADLRDAGALKLELTQLDFSQVVHLGAISFVGHGEAKAFYEVNTLGATNLLDGLLVADKKDVPILLSSSANVYGNAKVSPIEETAPLAPVNHYAMSKMAMETLAQNYLDRLDIRISRPFNYTGPGQDPSFLIPKLVHHFKSRSPILELGNLDVAREFNDVRMVCEAYLKILEKGRSGEIYNICSGVGHRLRDVLAILRDLTNHDPAIHVNPAFVRANEIRQLTGSPGKLEGVTGPLLQYALRDTLAWMLEA